MIPDIVVNHSKKRSKNHLVNFKGLLSKKRHEVIILIKCKLLKQHRIQCLNHFMSLQHDIRNLTGISDENITFPKN